MKKVADPYFDAIRLAVETVESYCPATQEEFLNDTMCSDAILLRLFEIGELLHTLRAKFEEEFYAAATPEWHKIIGLRNIIAHEYGQINLEIIWGILTEKLPAFKEEINKQLKK